MRLNYAGRGLSLDTELAPNFALEQSLAALSMRGLLEAGSVKSVAIVGAGLDFTDKNAGFDFYPVQTVQPFAVLDSLRRLQLATTAGDVDIVALDISPSVIDHVGRIRAQAARGMGYTLNLPLLKNREWLPEFRDYWKRFGDHIGVPVAATANKAIGDITDVRAVHLSARTAERLSVEDLNVVTQRLDGQKFDLVIATNVLLYYDALDQAIALANISSMLRNGGFLLSNTVLPEVEALPIRLAGFLDTRYSRDNDYDVVLWYQRLASPLR
jgi:SAM-dependent methyltransferase